MNEEKWMEVYSKQTAAIEKLEQQRDELLDAAIKARRALAHADSKAPGLYGAEYAELDNAIAKARGQHE